jgi:hypothetical protein
MSLKGGCHCGALRYRVQGDPKVVLLCHCSDCQKSAGAPVVSWATFAEENFEITAGNSKIYESSAVVARHFCADCGTGILFKNAERFPGEILVQSATFDDAAAHPALAHVYIDDRLMWMDKYDRLPTFSTYPKF